MEDIVTDLSFSIIDFKVTFRKTKVPLINANLHLFHLLAELFHDVPKCLIKLFGIMV